MISLKRERKREDSHKTEKDGFLVRLRELAYVPGDFNIFPKASVILIAVAIILLVIALASDRGDMTSAMLVAVSLINFLMAIIMLVFAGPRGVHPGICSMLYPSLVSDKAGILSELNVYGDAVFIPGFLAGAEETVQFNPVGEYEGFDYRGSVFAADNEKTAGVFSKPSSSSLMKYLVADYGLTIPSDDGSPGVLEDLLDELLTEVTSFCEEVGLGAAGEEIVVDLKRPVFIKGCKDIRSDSPKCCTVSPCPVCSLICSVVAEYYGSVMTISSVKVNWEAPSVSLIIRPQ